jgi:hypothetical protein
MLVLKNDREALTFLAIGALDLTGYILYDFISSHAAGQIIPQATLASLIDRATVYLTKICLVGDL